MALCSQEIGACPEITLSTVDACYNLFNRTLSVCFIRNCLKLGAFNVGMRVGTE